MKFWRKPAAATPPRKPCLMCEQRGHKCQPCNHAEIFGKPDQARGAA